MKRDTPVLIVFIAICYWLIASSFSADGNNPFFDIVKNAGIKFTQPANTIETAIISNDELSYQYALKDTVNKIEIRYLLYPLQGLVKKYNGPHSDTGMRMIDPNFLHTNLLLAVSLKVQGKEMKMTETMPAIEELSHATADLEFNADWGAMANVEPCDEFAQKYKYCTVFEIHKEDTADAFIIYLYNDKDTFEELVKPDFHSLVFNK